MEKLGEITVYGEAFDVFSNNEDTVLVDGTECKASVKYVSDYFMGNFRGSYPTLIFQFQGKWKEVRITEEQYQHYQNKISTSYNAGGFRDDDGFTSLG